MKTGQLKFYVLRGLRAVVGDNVVERALIARNMRAYEACGLLFIHIPKCAGTSISRALYGRSLGHRTARQLREFDAASFSRLQSFAVLRDPVSRAYSAWRYCRDGGSKEGWAAPHPDYALPEFENFELFATEWLPARRLDSLDYVFRSQASFVNDAEGVLLVDRLVRLDELPTVWPEIVAGRNVVSKQVGTLNSKGGARGREPEVSDAAKDSLRAIYRRDFALYDGAATAS